MQHNHLQNVYLASFGPFCMYQNHQNSVTMLLKRILVWIEYNLRILKLEIFIDRTPVLPKIRLFVRTNQIASFPNSLSLGYTK